MAETMLDSDRVNVPQRLPVLVASFLSLVRCHNQVPWDELKTQLGAKEAAWKRGKSYYGLDCLESVEIHDHPATLCIDTCILAFTL